MTEDSERAMAEVADLMIERYGEQSLNPEMLVEAFDACYQKGRAAGQRAEREAIAAWLAAQAEAHEPPTSLALELLARRVGLEAHRGPHL